MYNSRVIVQAVDSNEITINAIFYYGQISIFFCFVFGLHFTNLVLYVTLLILCVCPLRLSVHLSVCLSTWSFIYSVANCLGLSFLLRRDVLTLWSLNILWLLLSLRWKIFVATILSCFRVNFKTTKILIDQQLICCILSFLKSVSFIHPPKMVYLYIFVKYPANYQQ